MFSLHNVVGGVLVLYTLIVLVRGRISVYDSDSRYSGRRNEVGAITRAEKPVQYWLLVILFLGIAAALFINVFHLP